MHAWTSISIRIIYPCICFLQMLEADILLAVIIVLCAMTYYLSLQVSAATPIFNGTFGGYTRDTNQAEQNTSAAIPIFNGTFGGYTRDTNQAEQKNTSVAIPIFNGTIPSIGGYTGDTNQAEQNTTNTTLTRYGNDLNFDPETCPSDSLMAMSKLEHATPLHNDCPTLFIVGARKGGTTSLYQYVSKHPDFKGVNLNKGLRAGETFYFEHHRFIDSMQSWQYYQNLFPQDASMSGDSSVGNLLHCKVPQRLFTSCGKQAKVVMLFRNPIERFVSNYLMRFGFSTRSYRNVFYVAKNNPIEKYIKGIMNRGVISQQIEKDWTKLLCLFGPGHNMVFEGIYYVHLLNWLCNFPAENIMIINSEEFFASPTTILRQVFEFIGLHQVSNETLQAFTSNV